MPASARPDGRFVMLLISFLVGLEASTLRRFTLARRGWRNIGLVSGTNWKPPSGVSSTTGPRPGRAAPARSRRRVAAFARAAAALAADRRAVSRTGRVPMSVAIVDYGSGNLHSAAKAFERAAHDAGIDQPIVVTSDPDTVAAADRVVLPGVGAFADCRRGLDAVDGMVDALEEAVHRKGRPFFGICVGMQLLAERGREYEVTPGPGLDRRRSGPHHAVRSAAEDPAHGLEYARPSRGRTNWSKALGLVLTGRHAYFVHSYAFNVAQRADLVAEAEYGGPITAIVGRDNIVGTQFHPEKSQKLGLALIANFLTWKP